MSKLEGRLVLISDNARLWSGSKRRARGQHQGARKLGQICDWDFGAREPRTGSNQIYPFGMYPNATLRRSNSPEHRTTCLWCGHLCKFLCPSPKSTVTDDSIQRSDMHQTFTPFDGDSWESMPHLMALNLRCQEFRTPQRGMQTSVLTIL